MQLFPLLLSAIYLLGHSQARSFYIIGDSLTCDWLTQDFYEDAPRKSGELAGWGSHLHLYTKWNVKNAALNGLSARSFLQMFDKNPQNGKSACAFPNAAHNISDFGNSWECHKLDSDDVVVLILGVNDRCHKSRNDKEICSACRNPKKCPPGIAVPKKGETVLRSFKENLQIIIRKLRAKQPGVTILVTSNVPIIDGNQGDYTPNEFFETYRDVVREAKDPKIHFVDFTAEILNFFNSFTDRRDYMKVFHSIDYQFNEDDKVKRSTVQRDIHPNYYGAKMYAALFSCALKNSKFQGDYLSKMGQRVKCGDQVLQNLKLFKIDNLKYQITPQGKADIIQPPSQMSNIDIVRHMFLKNVGMEVQFV